MIPVEANVAVVFEKRSVLVATSAKFVASSVPLRRYRGKVQLEIALEFHDYYCVGGSFPWFLELLTAQSHHRLPLRIQAIAPKLRKVLLLAQAINGMGSSHLRRMCDYGGQGDTAIMQTRMRQMPTAPLTQMLPSRVAEVGALLRRNREERGLSLVEFAALVSEHLGRKMDHTRISKIELASQPAAQDRLVSYARALRGDEIIAFAKVIEIPKEILDGASANGGIPFDPMAEPERAQDIIDLMQFADRDSQELLGWGEVLPCSLETQAFMEAHHAGLFREIGDDEYFHKVTNYYNRLGTNRRQRLMNTTQRPWTFRHIILLSDLEAIAQGIGPEYSGISADLRKDCLQELVNLLSSEAMNVSLVISQGPRPFWTRGLDSLVVFDEKLAFWRLHNGTFYWTTNVEEIRKHRNRLVQFSSSARFIEARDVIGILTSFYRETSGTAPNPHS